MEIEYTPANLSRFPLSHLQDILEEEGKSLKGTKWELIQRILNLRISRRKTIFSLPSDVLQLIGSYLRIDDICRLCSTTKRFNQQFCQNSRFWKRRLENGFSKVNLSDLEPGQFREEYLKRYSNFLREKTTLIRIEPNQGDPKLPQLEKEINGLKAVLNSLIAEHETLLRHVKEENNQDYELSRRLESHFETRKRFINIRVSTTEYHKIINFLKVDQGVVGDLQYDLNATIFGKGLYFGNGVLIGFSRDNIKSHPEILIYIYEPLHKIHQYSYKINRSGEEYGLPLMMKKYEGGKKEVNRKYGTRF